MTIEEMSGLRQPADSDNLWRYMCIDAFISLLKTKCLHFSFLSEQKDDLLEGRMTGASRRIVESVYKDPKKADMVASNSDQAMRSLGTINCWTLIEDEHIRCWETYVGKDRLGVAIKTTWGDLKNSLKHARHRLTVSAGMVHYEDRNRTTFGMLHPNVSGGVTLYAQQVYLKEPRYEWEQEFRLSVRSQDTLIVNGVLVPHKETKKGILIDVNPTDLITELVLPPWVDNESEWDMMSRIKRELSVSGLHNPVISKSKFHHNPSKKGTVINLQDLTPQEVAHEVNDVISIFKPFVDEGWSYREADDHFGTPAVYKALKPMEGMKFEVKVYHHMSARYYILEIPTFAGGIHTRIEFKEDGLNPKPVMSWVETLESSIASKGS